MQCFPNSYKVQSSDERSHWPPLHRIAPFSSIMEARVGGKAQFHAAFFHGVPRSLTNAHGRHYTTPSVRG